MLHQTGAKIVLSSAWRYMLLGWESFTPAKQPPGLPPAGAGLSASKLKLAANEQRSISAEFNGEKVYGQTWDATQGHLVFLEINQ